MAKRDHKKPNVEVKPAAADTKLAYRDFPGPRGADALLRVAVDRSAYGDLTAHAKESLEAEVCGVLIGHACEDDEGTWVHVQAIIRGTAARQGSTHVTFTQETWNIVHETLERDHAGKRIVGWYHTHPGFGVEFSEMDLFVQRNFFPGAGQVALVTDPLGGAVAICVNAGGGIEYLERFWVDGREQPCRRPTSATASPVAEPSAASAGENGRAIKALEERVAQLIQALDDTRTLVYRMVAIVGVVCCAGVIAAVFFLVRASYNERIKPPENISFAPIPVRVDDRNVMLGVGVVQWDVPPELDAIYHEMARLALERQAEAERRAAEEAARKATENPADKPAAAPAAP